MKLRAIILLTALHLSSQAQSIKIAAAADLRYAMDEIVRTYKASQPNADIEVIYGSSGNAYTQISNGATYDIYFSADIMYPRKLAEAGLTLTEPKHYAIGRIVLWSASLDVSKGLTVLKEKPSIKIATANPDHAPYGQRSMEALEYYKLLETVKKNMIYGENISQAAQFCLTGNADAGLLALSIVLSPAMKSIGKYYLIDNKAHRPLEQGYVILKNAKGKQNVYALTEYISTPPARMIFEKYGFELP